MLGAEPKSSESVASSHNPWTIFLAPTLHFHMMTLTHTLWQKNILLGRVCKKKTFQVSNVTGAKLTIFYSFLIKSYNFMSKQEESVRG